MSRGPNFASRKARSKRSGKITSEAAKEDETRLEQQRFLDAIGKLGTATAAALTTEIPLALHRSWLLSPDYRLAFRYAKQEARERLEYEARRRAMLGVDRPVIYQGQLMTYEDPRTEERRPLTIKEYSDSLMIHLLKLEEDRAGLQDQSASRAVIDRRLARVRQILDDLPIAKRKTIILQTSAETKALLGLKIP